MDKQLFAIFIERGKTYNKMTKVVAERHVGNIRRLDDEGKLEYCGVFKGFPGVAGMYIVRASSLEEAKEICKQEPLVEEGLAKAKAYPFEVANRENNYLF